MTEEEKPVYESLEDVPEEYREIAELLQKAKDENEADSAKLRNVKDGWEIVLFFKDE